MGCNSGPVGVIDTSMRFHMMKLWRNRGDGTKTNRCAIGVKIRLLTTEDGVARSIYKDVTSGSSFGANPLRQLVGTGSATVIDTLVVYWPTSDTTQVFHNVASDSGVSNRRRQGRTGISEAGAVSSQKADHMIRPSRKILLPLFVLLLAAGGLLATW